MDREELLRQSLRLDHPAPKQQQAIESILRRFRGTDKPTDYGVRIQIRSVQYRHNDVRYARIKSSKLF